MYKVCINGGLHAETVSTIPARKTMQATAMVNPSPNYLSLALIKKSSKDTDVRFAQKQLKLYFLLRLLPLSWMVTSIRTLKTL